MEKIFLKNEDFLPGNKTFGEFMAGDENNLTEEELASFLTADCLEMTEDDLIDYLNDHQAGKIPVHYQAPKQRMAYAEDLDENDPLNQEFPEPTDQKQ